MLSALIKLFTFGLLICCNVSIQAQVKTENKQGEIRLFHASMKPGVACYRIPALVTAPNGDLIAAIDERLGPLLPALEQLLRAQGLSLDELARPPGFGEPR